MERILSRVMRSTCLINTTTLLQNFPRIAAYFATVALSRLQLQAERVLGFASRQTRRDASPVNIHQNFLNPTLHAAANL